MRRRLYARASVVEGLGPLQAFAAFAVIGLPLGFALQFIGFQVARWDAIQWLVSFIAIYLLIAVPEELLFRGIIQNLIEQRWGRSWPTLVAASIIFWRGAFG